MESLAKFRVKRKNRAEGKVSVQEVFNHISSTLTDDEIIEALEICLLYTSDAADE